MAHGYLSYQDTRGESNILGDIVSLLKVIWMVAKKGTSRGHACQGREFKEQAALAAENSPRLLWERRRCSEDLLLN